MNNAALSTQNSAPQVNVEPLLATIFKEAQKEHEKLQEVFELMGWGDLPDALKIEIKDDVTAMVRELEGQYASCDPFVKQRRRRVTYWVDTFRAGTCSLQTAIDALKVTKL